MKNFTLLVFTTLLLFSTVCSQEWIQNLPQDKLENGNLNFFEMQEAFYDYWEPFNVENGYYMLDGEKVKAPYYKQFKRWEWYWESRVNPKTGEFPDMEELDKYYASLAENKSQGGNWTGMGPYTVPVAGYAGLGRLNCVAFVPNSPNEYYTGAASGGIWYTNDNGSNWVNLNDTVPVLGVSDILVNSPVTGPDILYIATGDRDGGSMWSLGGQQSNDNNSVGVLKSIDGGATWNTTGLTFTASQKIRVNRLLMDPGSAYQIIYAATTIGVYKTVDAGVNWNFIAGSPAFIDMEFKPGDPTTLYGSTEGWTNTYIYRSTNSGANWSSVANYPGRRTELAVSYNQPTWVYALVCNTSGGMEGIYKSTNSGISYPQVLNGSISGNYLLNWSCYGTGTNNGQGTYDLVIAADPTNANVVYVGGVNTWKSTDGGLNWNINNHWTNSYGCGVPEVHADKHFFAFQNGTSTLFEANDGGLYKTSDGGVNWSHLSNGMAISQIYRLGVGQTNADEVILGLQDNGSKARLSGVWTDIIGGDGFECIIDYTNQNTQYGALYFGDIYRTTDYWVNKTQITGSLPGQGAWCTPYIMDPTNNQTLYVGYSDVWKTTNQGTSWSQISNQGGSTDFQNMAISTSNHNYIYAATHSNIYRTTNGGGPTQTWTNITSNLPVGSSQITYIAVKNDNPDHVWVSMGEYNSNGVYETTNGGTSWTNISSGLPQLPVMCVIQNNQYAGIELYAATDVGVYVMRDGGSWVPFSDGLPNVVVTELEIYYDGTPTDSKIYAASYGRGVWTSDLYSPYAVPIADFSGSPTSGLPPLDVAFLDLSQNTIASWAWDFGDGNTSTLQNPVNTYNNPGLYSVQLVVVGPGGSDSITKTDYIQIDYFPPTADFIADVTTGVAPLTVNFTDLSVDSVDTWSWDFGNGDTSSDQNPQYIYNDPGLYTVSLYVTGPGGTDTHTKTDYILVSHLPPIANFVGNPTSGFFPLLVNFTDLTSGAVSQWKWYFGDGVTSTIQHPAHTYQNSGNYTVSLKSTGPGGSDSIAKVNYITVLVGIEELNTETLKVYPNPCNDYLMISSKESVRSIKMADIIGNIVKDELLQ
ncbi:MAG: PKD domain-containing protein, partial [Bacteroidales bacterium]|nr:PKD domain-containing protein [Bacteroidales bacterium]